MIGNAQKKKNGRATSSRSKGKKVVEPTAFFNHLDFSLLGTCLTSHKPVNNGSSPTDLIRSDFLVAVFEFQSSRRYVDGCSLVNPSNRHPVQFDPVRLGNVSKQSVQTARRHTIPLICRVLIKCSTSFWEIITVILMAELSETT
jgi:hypothetical protein